MDKAINDAKVEFFSYAELSHIFNEAYEFLQCLWSFDNRKNSFR
jgi:hypothetical protein